MTVKNKLGYRMRQGRQDKIEARLTEVFGYKGHLARGLFSHQGTEPRTEGYYWINRASGNAFYLGDTAREVENKF